MRLFRLIRASELNCFSTCFIDFFFVGWSPVVRQKLRVVGTERSIVASGTSSTVPSRPRQILNVRTSFPVACFAPFSFLFFPGLSSFCTWQTGGSQQHHLIAFTWLLVCFSVDTMQTNDDQVWISQPTHLLLHRSFDNLSQVAGSTRLIPKLMHVPTSLFLC